MIKTDMEVLSKRLREERAAREAAEQESAERLSLIGKLHDLLRSTQDDLATLRVQYDRVCEAIPPSYGRKVHSGDAERDAAKRGAMDAAIAFEDSPPPEVRVRQKAKCDACGQMVFVNSFGALWAHDVNGHTYRGDMRHRADKSKRCRGKAVTE